jgi:hypothetical protein
MADLDIQTVLRWLIIGVLVLIGLSLLGLLINVAEALLSLGLRVGVVVLVILLVVRLVDRLRS